MSSQLSSTVWLPFQADVFPAASSSAFSCLAEHETECPNCAREYGVIREIRRNNERLANQHDVFLSEVQEGGFDAIAAAFGRGLLNLSKTGEMS